MNIFYSALDTEFPGTHGGSTHVEETVRALTKLNHNVILACKHTSGQKLVERKGKLKIYRFPLLFKSGVLKQIHLFKVAFFFYFLIFLFHKIDVVWERARIFGGQGTLYGALFNKKKIYELNEPLLGAALESKRFSKNSTIFNLLKNQFNKDIDRADVVTVTHKSMAQGIPEKKVWLTDYGVNSAKFKPFNVAKLRKKLKLTKGKTILYSGSFRKWHAVEEIVLAAEKVVKKDKKIKFLLIGKGEEFKKVEKLVTEKELQENVLLLGEVSYDKMPNYINAADICLALFDWKYPLFKKFDYFYSPLKVHEYKACGKAIIASSLGNLKKLVKSKTNGISVRSNAPSVVADAILSLIKKPKTLLKIGKINRKEALEQYNWVLITKNILGQVIE